MNPLLISPLLDLLGKGLDKIFPDKAEAERAKLRLLELQQAGEFKELEARMAAITTEAASADPWTSRARPSFLYVMYVMLLAAIPAGALFVFWPDEVTRGIEGFRLWLDAIPGELYALFGAGYLGYAHYRTWDKKAAK